MSVNMENELSDSAKFVPVYIDKNIILSLKVSIVRSFSALKIQITACMPHGKKILTI